MASRNLRGTNVKKKSFPSQVPTSSIDGKKNHFKKIALEKNLYEFPTAAYVLLITLGLIRPLLLRRLVEF